MAKGKTVRFKQFLLLSQRFQKVFAVMRQNASTGGKGLILSSLQEQLLRNRKQE